MPAAYRYFIPGLVTGLNANPMADPKVARLVKAGPWQESAGTVDGKSGIFLKHAAAETPKDSTPWITTDDDLMFQCETPPTLADVARTECPAASTVALASGAYVSVALAVEAPRVYLFGSRAAGAPVGEFSKAIAEAAMVEAGQNFPVELVERVVIHAIGECYHTTAEILNAMGIITTRDIKPLWESISGADPK
jgi:hypothetical protein